MQPITYAYKHTDGLVIECHLEYDPPDRETGFMEPDAVLIRALVAGIDVSGIMSDKLIDRIERAAAWSMLE